MKYINMMAGAFGLLALAACTNNDEVKMEQPQVARTLTVTLGNGADTRMTLSEFDANEGIKGSWESTDEIGVVNFSEPEKLFTYKSTGSGPSVVFTLDGTEGPTVGKTYFIAYPKSAITEGFDFSMQTGLQKDLKNYACAMSTVDSFSALDNKVTLTPLCSFLYIPKGTVFPDYNVESSGAFIIEVEGENLVPQMMGTSEETSIKIDVDGSMFDKATTKEDLYIALPFTGKKNDTYTPITNLQFTIMPSATTKSSVPLYTYSIVKDESADSPVPVEITAPGKVYVLAAKNLLLLEK